MLLLLYSLFLFLSPPLGYCMTEFLLFVMKYILPQAIIPLSLSNVCVHSFPIVEPDPGHTKLRLSREGLEAIEKITNPIASVAVSLTATISIHFCNFEFNLLFDGDFHDT